MKKTHIGITYKILALWGIFIFISQPLLVLAADPPTASSTSSTSAPLVPSDNPAEMNSAIDKSLLSTLTINFDNTAVKNGDTITATALPTGFAYNDDSLYYTWFIKHSGVSDPNEWKIEAAKIIARGKFDKTNANYANQVFDDKEKGYLALPNWKGDAGEQSCYQQDYATGQIWELSSSDSVFNCPNGATAQCVKDQVFAASPNECVYDNPLFNPLLPEDPITNPKTKKEGNKNACVQAGDSVKNSMPDCKTRSAQNFDTPLTCASGYEAKCVANTGALFPQATTDLQVCSALPLGNLGQSCGGASGLEVKPIDVTGAETTLSCTRELSKNKCKHLFAEEPKDIGKIGDGKYTLDEEKFWGTDPSNKSTAGNANNDEMNLVGLGQNQFTWTYQTGDMIGVVVEGMSEQGTKHSDSSKMITWAYSKNTCPAFTKKVANTPADQKEYYIDKNSENKTQAGILNIDDFDPNDCLKDNLIDPAVSGTGTLDVSLTYSPENPTNYPAATGGANAGLSKGDVVSVVSTINNVADASGYYYTWSIEGRKDNTGMQNIDDDGWFKITSAFSDHTALSGIGKTNFDFKLNLNKSDFPDNSDLNPKYIRVKLTVNESSDAGSTSRIGASQAVIKINNPTADLIAYPVNILDGKPVINKDFIICDQNTDPCPVVKGEIIAMELPNNDPTKFTQFDWTYNKDSLLCDKSISSECDDTKPIDKAFFPVVGQEGDSFNVKLTAKKGETGINQDFNKTFNIVKPAVGIASADTNVLWRKVIGYNKDLGGNVSPVYGQGVFQAVTNTKVEMKAIYSPTFIKRNLPLQWSINGEKVNTEPNGNLKLDVNEPIGSSYNVDIAGIYSQRDEVRKALSDVWSINAFESREQQVETSAQIEMMESDTEDSNNVGTISPTHIFASLITNIPQQLMFFMRIIITTALLLLVTGVIFSVIPGVANREHE